MTLETLLFCAVQDMKDNAQQIVNTEGTQEETSSKLVAFFAAVEELGGFFFKWLLLRILNLFPGSEVPVEVLYQVPHGIVDH